MSIPDEQVLVVQRSLFDGLGSFQGFCGDWERYLTAFLKKQNNFFAPRSSAENDPSLKQIIPYAVFTHGGKILHYVRGAKSGEKRWLRRDPSGSAVTSMIRMRVCFPSTTPPIIRPSGGKSVRN